MLNRDITYRISNMTEFEPMPGSAWGVNRAPWPAEMSVGCGLMGGMETFTLVPRGPFSLAASIRFLEGFTPAWYSSPADGGPAGRVTPGRTPEAPEKLDWD